MPMKQFQELVICGYQEIISQDLQKITQFLFKITNTQI